MVWVSIVEHVTQALTKEKIGLMWIPHATYALAKAKLGPRWIPCVP
jgi:hypothetical protein